MFNYPDEIFEWENVMHKQIENMFVGIVCVECVL